MQITVDSAELREVLGRAVDEAVRSLELEVAGALHVADSADPYWEPIVGRVSHAEAFLYRWPDGFTESYDDAGLWKLTIGTGTLDAVLAWTTRRAWGRDRRRAVVFHRIGGDADRWYPWTEFVETDGDRFAAPLPNPERPRAALADGDEIPDMYDGWTIVRADGLFDPIRSGPSLRIVVGEEDEERMVLHGYRVARLRGRIG